MMASAQNQDAALAALRELAARADATTEDDMALRAFLDWLAHASRAGWPSSPAERAAFVAASGSLVRTCALLLGKHVDAIMRMFSSPWYGDEWIRACEARSRLEFLRELYRDSAAEAALAEWTDPSDIDDAFRQRGEVEGSLKSSEIPPGTPHSHWWWWYPRPPGQATT